MLGEAVGLGLVGLEADHVSGRVSEGAVADAVELIGGLLLQDLGAGGAGASCRGAESAFRKAYCRVLSEPARARGTR